MTFQQALSKTRGGFLSRLFGRKAEEPLTPEFIDELEEGLLRADLSVSLVDPLMAQPMTIRTALAGTFVAGVFTALALVVRTGELYFIWAGPLAAGVLSDTTRPRNFAYSALAFVIGFLAISWITL